MRRFRPGEQRAGVKACPCLQDLSRARQKGNGVCSTSKMLSMKLGYGHRGKTPLPRQGLACRNCKGKPHITHKGNAAHVKRFWSQGQQVQGHILACGNCERAQHKGSAVHETKFETKFGLGARSGAKAAPCVQAMLGHSPSGHTRPTATNFRRDSSHLPSGPTQHTHHQGKSTIRAIREYSPSGHTKCQSHQGTLTIRANTAHSPSGHIRPTGTGMRRGSSPSPSGPARDTHTREHQAHSHRGEEGFLALTIRASTAHSHQGAPGPQLQG